MTTTSGNARRGIIEPWLGSGWPIDLFEAKTFFEKKGVFFCSRSECGIGNRRILRDPWQLNCGHRVCKECYDKLGALPEAQQLCEACTKELFDEGHLNLDRKLRLESGHDFLLNKDGMSYDAAPPSTSQQPSLADEVPTRVPFKIDFSIAMKDKAVDREISRLLVNCPYGCDTPAKLTLRTLERHMEECLERWVPCEKCAEVIKYLGIGEHRTKCCPFRIVECPNKCGVAGLRAKDLAKKKVQVVKHLNEGKRMDQHLKSIMTKLHTTTTQSSSGPATVISQSQISDLQKRLLTLENQSDRANRMLMDKVHHMTPEMARGLLENVQLAQRNRQDLNDLNSLFKTVAQDVHKLTSYEGAFCALTEKISKTENETAELLSRLETLSNIRVAEIEDQKTLLNQLQMTSYNGHLLWKITDVQKHRDEAATRHSIYSHPFYTETYGYKMCARVFVNGDGSGKNTHISLFFVVMKGEYDALQTWPFQKKVTMKLRNVTENRPDIVEMFRPEPSSFSFQRPKNEMNIASGCPQFADQAHVFNPDNGFVVDDTMYIEIMVNNESTAGLNSPQHVYDNED
ncbi:hypothetical protein EB796_021137 [Bugula neritina]|uniref:MATH domain-containing protein n=1 Tax=Bugula neritina TaxID=10212 RepID=A0A7J7J4F6_BUGNE|nr:hypothetical protein EB796_021137 [Bugula neritina]